jgi:hypothetical protein
MVASSRSSRILKNIISPSATPAWTAGWAILMLASWLVQVHPARRISVERTKKMFFGKIEMVSIFMALLPEN